MIANESPERKDFRPPSLTIHSRRLRPEAFPHPWSFVPILDHPPPMFGKS